MAFRSSLTGLMAALVATSIIFTTADATIFTVGESFGWRIPESNPSIYNDWASSKTFKLGDMLEFPGREEVVQVTKAGYKACSDAEKISKISNALTTNPATFNLNVSGISYFICSIPGHCEADQKLSITVDSSTPAPLSPPTASELTPSTTPVAIASSPSPPTAGDPTLSTAPVSDGEISAAASLPAGFSLVVVVASSFIF